MANNFSGLSWGWAGFTVFCLAMVGLIVVNPPETPDPPDWMRPPLYLRTKDIEEIRVRQRECIRAGGSFVLIDEDNGFWRFYCGVTLEHNP